MTRILLVDDDELVRYALAKALRRAGHEVLEAASGEGVPARVEAESIEILITDLVMPDQEGIGLIRELRAVSATLPIIAISGGGRVSGEQYLRMAARLGALHLELDDPEQAIRWFADALALEPDNEDAQAGLGLLLEPLQLHAIQFSVAGDLRAPGLPLGLERIE